MDKLAALLARRAATDPRAAASGLVINTFGWVDGLGYELQKYAIQAFGVSGRVWGDWGPGSGGCGARHAISAPGMRVCGYAFVASISRAHSMGAGTWGGRVHRGLSLWSSFHPAPPCRLAAPPHPQADVVLVMEQDRLHAQLQQDLKVGVAGRGGGGPWGCRGWRAVRRA